MCNANAQLHGLHRATTQCMADTTYGAMHICLGTGSNAQCVAGNCHDTSSECTTAGQICGLTTPHVCGGCGGSDTACKGDARYGNTTICLANRLRHRRLPRHVHRVHRRQDLRRLDAAHLRRLRGGRRRDTQCTGDTRYGSRQHLLPGQLPGR